MHSYKPNLLSHGFPFVVENLVVSCQHPTHITHNVYKTISSHITVRTFTAAAHINMPSSKGNPTDPELREEIKEGQLPWVIAT